MRTTPPPPLDVHPSRKRSSSWNNDEDKKNDDTDADAAFATNQDAGVAVVEDSQQQQQQQQQQHNQQRHFRQWASMSIDRTRMQQPQQRQDQQNGISNSNSNNNNMMTPPPVELISPGRIDINTSNTNKGGGGGGGGRGGGRGTKTVTTTPRSAKSNKSKEHYFLSDPSISEEESETEIGSSRADFAKKLLYQRKLREFDAAHGYNRKHQQQQQQQQTTTTTAFGGNLDALSVGDNTSLSSSNISPTPQRFRIHFESVGVGVVGVGGGQIKTNIGKMRNKLKAAARLSFSSIMHSDSDGNGTASNTNNSNNNSNSNNNNNNTANAGGEMASEENARSPSEANANDNDDMMRAASMPPSSLSGSAASARDERSDDPPPSDPRARRAPPRFRERDRFDLDLPATGIAPPLPDLGGVDAAPRREDRPSAPGGDDRIARVDVEGRSTNSASSADSVRGVGIATEQSGGESSSSAFRGFEGGGSGSYSNRGPVATKGGSGWNGSNGSNGGSDVRGTGGADASPPRRYGDKSHPDGDPSRRARRKGASHHRRMRSGDAVAATLMNSGREDWIGMSMDNIPIPEGVASGMTTDDDDGSGSALFAAMVGREGGIAVAGGGGREEDRSTFSNASNESPPLFAYGSNGNVSRVGSGNASHGRSTPTSNADGYSADASADVARFRRSATDGYSADASVEARRGGQGLRRTSGGTFVRGTDSTVSADTFDFSDSAGGGSAGRIARSDGVDPNPNRDVAVRSSSFERPNPNRAWGDGGNDRDHRHARYSSHVPTAAAMHGSLPPNMSMTANAAWLNSYQMANGMQNNPLAANGMPTNYNHQRNGSILPSNYSPRREESYESSSGLSASCSSSSYTDNTERMADENGEAGSRVRPSPVRSVKFEDPSNDTKFDRAMKRVQSVLDRPLYRLDGVIGVAADDTNRAPMFYCPNCKTKQRDYINFATASGLYDSPQGYLAAYFALYLVSSLFVFGLEEGWQPLDCIYFSVITLTTAGLGDFVPSTDGGKVVCACFIYVGVATIGLLLGSLLAGSMDNASRKEAREAQIRDCPNCARFEKLKRRTTPNLKTSFYSMGDDASSYHEDQDNVGLDLCDTSEELSPTKAPGNNQFSQLRQAQIHTRHMSINYGATMPDMFGTKPELRRSISGVNPSEVPPSIDESTPFLRTSGLETGIAPGEMEMKSFDDSYSSSCDTDESITLHPSKPMTRVKAAKYVFLTLNKALVNSSFIIAGGSLGFYYIEDMSAVDSFYFTTVLLTSVGYGDIVPVTTAGKVFATFFVIIAGTVLLHNMTLISMIPLELRKRRIEHAVLEQFGNQLTDDELRELSTGRLINRLKLATNRPDGLEECTREMFSLAMLVRLGRITEDDVKATFAAFRRLDAGNYGTLNSRTIIEGEFRRRKSVRNLVEMSPHAEWEQTPRHYSRESSSQVPNYATEYASPNPYISPTDGTLARNHSVGSYYSQGLLSGASEFDYDAYDRWASNFNQYSPSPPPNDNAMGAY